MPWLKFGMLFPWIGFRAVTEEERSVMELCDCCKWSAFSIEWLGHGIIWVKRG